MKLDSRQVQQPEVWSLDIQSETRSFREPDPFQFTLLLTLLVMTYFIKTYLIQMYKDCTGSQLLGAVKTIYFTLQSVAWFGAWECWFLWEHQDLWGMGWLLFVWLFAVALECCELCRLWEQWGCAGTRPGSFLSCAWEGDAILWLVILVGAWGRLYLYSTELCAINRKKFSDLEGGLISLTIFLIFMFCHLGFFSSCLLRFAHLV